MKTLHTKILAGLLVAMLLSLAACTKEQPAPAVGPSDISLSLQENTTLKQYAGKTTTLHFSIKVPDAGKSAIELSITGPGKAELNKSMTAGSGQLSITLDKEADSDVTAALSLSCSGASKKYTITVTPYYFKGEIKTVVVGPDVASRTQVEYTVETNLETYQVSLQLAENSYFVLEGNEVVALRGNVTGEDRTCIIFLKESSGAFNNIYGKVSQSTRPPFPPEEIVQFQDAAFKSAMVEVADINLDGEITLEEALAVKEIDINGRNVSRLDGIEAFRNVWKLDAQNNDIKDGSEIAQMPSLYWLDLKGNKNLSTFDVTGCTLYFQHCEFEITDNLVYYTTRQQVQVTNASDPMCEHSRHVLDPRQTTDWSDQDETVLIKRHTEGKGYPIILTGISYIDIDMQDGSFMRMMNDVVDVIAQYDIVIKDYAKYIDFYAVKHKAVDRNQYFIEMDETNLDNPKMLEITNKVRNDQIELFEKIYNEFFPDQNSTKEMYPIFVEINPSGSSMCPIREKWGINLLSKKSPFESYYLHVLMAENNETAYKWTGSYAINITNNETDLITLLQKIDENSCPGQREYFETNVKN